MNESLDANAVIREILDLAFNAHRRLVEKSLHRVLRVGVFRVGGRWFCTADGWRIYEVRDDGSFVVHPPWTAYRVCRAKYAAQCARDFAGTPLSVLLSIRDRLRDIESRR
jgi:hypothetical protein